MAEPQVHEDYLRVQEIEGPSNRSFGITFAAVFLIVALWPLPGGGEVRLWALGAAGAFLLLALAAPRLLAPLNRLWLKFGLLLHNIVTPVILGLIFFLIVLPIGLMLRLLGRRPLSVRPDPDQVSYWVRRDADAQPGSMRNQF